METILAINCGSSSLKFGLYSASSESTGLIFEGEAEEIGRKGSQFWLSSEKQGGKRQENVPFETHEHAAEHVLDILAEVGERTPTAVGHRIVHGGPKLREHKRVTPAIREQLKEAIQFAPIHLPPALAVLDAVERRLPGTLQIVCLDTAFHRTMPDVSRMLALPRQISNHGIERYGFHGLSLESILQQLSKVPERLVIAHLGNGCSVTAVRRGESVDTSMGLTPTGGVMMGTRCGDLDPGVLVYLMRDGYPDATSIERLVDHESGLLGVSRKTSDVRELVRLRRSDELADLALRMFCYQVRKAIASMAAALGGIDTLIFAGGIGEHNQELRDEICRELQFLGNFETRVVPAEEDLQIAKITARLMAR